MNHDHSVALAFMQALWASDLAAASDLLSLDARWLFQLGMPQAKPPGPGRDWPARAAMQRIVDDLFGKFDPDGFKVTVTRTVAEAGSVAIEYEASGRTANGLPYANYYVTLLRIANGKVIEVRPYNDTAHMLDLLG
jgi:uncharacterized protein